MSVKQSHFGSFIPLELYGNEINKSFHSEAIKINTARNALQLILEKRDTTKVYLPFFSCDALYIPMKRLGINYEFYSINKNFEPVFDYRNIKDTEIFIYINFFGINDSIVDKLHDIVDNLVIDNSQSFFSKPKNDVPTFYSARKFFGVADGAYLYDKLSKGIKLSYDVSYERYSYLLQNLDLGQSIAYDSYSKIEETFEELEVKKMSNLTSILLKKLPYKEYNKVRINNFNYLNDELRDINEFDLPNIEKGALCYPLLVENGKYIKHKLMSNSVFIPTYWANVLELVHEKDIEFRFVNDIISIHIDHRYNKEDLKKTVKLIKTYYNDKR